MRVLFFGDSIVQGMWDTKGGWVQRIKTTFDEQHVQTWEDEPEVINVGISGDRVEDVLARLEDEVRARRWFDEPLAIVMAVGINDTATAHTTAATEPYDFKKSYQKLIHHARKLSNHVIFVGLTPVDESAPEVTKVEYQYTNQRIQGFDTIAAELCQKEAVAWIDVFDAFRLEHEKRPLLSDGLHPNDEGHIFIASLVLPVLESMLAPPQPVA